MLIYKDYKGIRLENPVVTLGVFDGVHLGHRKLIDKLKLHAAKVKGESVVITFHPHPRIVLDRDPEKLSFLSTMDEKISLLEECGIDHLIIMEFTRELSRIRACDFIRKILVESMRSKYLVVGHDHHFGHQGEGDFGTIRECALTMGFEVEQVNGLIIKGRPVSSSLIRAALTEGRLSEANEFLGYDYFLGGQVVEGKKIGRKIGFPTANIRPDDRNKIIPANGVYAVEIYLDGIKYRGMLSIGYNPTINKKEGGRSIEVNIFDFSDDIYGRKIKIIFRFRLRDEKKFSDTGELTRQIRMDKENTLNLLK